MTIVEEATELLNMKDPTYSSDKYTELLDEIWDQIEITVKNVKQEFTLKQLKDVKEIDDDKLYGLINRAFDDINNIIDNSIFKNLGIDIINDFDNLNDYEKIVIKLILSI